ncbi:hypothetical protein D3C81_1844420 [compost metagenome]
MHQARRDRTLRGNRRHRHRIGRRQDGRQRKGGSQRNCRNHPVYEVTHADHGEQDQADRQRHDRTRIAEEGTLWNAPAVEEEQRRNEKQEKEFRIQRHADAETIGQHGAGGNLYKR